MDYVIDINKTIDLVKIKLYNEYLYTAHLYDEGDSPFHKDLTESVVTTYIDPLNLPKDGLILDMGCGPGYFLDEMKKRGYTNLLGITLTENDAKMCIEKGHTIKKYDLSFLPQSEGFYDESVDFIFCRHALEHSPYPIFTLMEYNRVLKQNAKIYIELPAPDGERKHEFNANHYSIFGHNMIAALLQRTGFKTETFNAMDFELAIKKEENSTEENNKTYKEKYYAIVATKEKGLDLK